MLPFQRLAMLLGSARESPPLEGQLASNGFDGVETFGPLYDDVAATRRLLVAMVSPRPPKFEWTFVFQGPHQGERQSRTSMAVARSNNVECRRAERSFRVRCNRRC